MTPPPIPERMATAESKIGDHDKRIESIIGKLEKLPDRIREVIDKAISNSHNLAQTKFDELLSTSRELNLKPLPFPRP